METKCNRRVEVLYNGRSAGVLAETKSGFEFSYYAKYCDENDSKSVSLSLLKSKETYKSKRLFNCFANRLAEGENRNVICKKLNISPDDSMGLISAIARNNNPCQDIISYKIIK